VASEGEILFADEGHRHGAGALDAGGDDIHAVGWRRDENGILPGAQNVAQQEVDALVGTAVTNTCAEATP